MWRGRANSLLGTVMLVIVGIPSTGKDWREFLGCAYIYNEVNP